jgi:hypothetical protein
MSNSEIRAALGSGRAVIEQQLSAAFSQLEAATGAVEIRKLLHAAFIRQAILTASARFPDNDALMAAIDEALASVRARIAASQTAVSQTAVSQSAVASLAQ